MRKKFRASGARSRRFKQTGLKGWPHADNALGSVMDVWPAHDYAQYVPQTSSQTRIAEHWSAVGQYLYAAVDVYAVERSNRR